MPRRLAAALLLALAAAGCGQDGEHRGAAPPPTTRPAAAVPNVTYTRSGGRKPPADRERLEIAPDGTFTLRRAVRSPLVGRFAGRLDAGQSSRLDRTARAAAAMDPSPPRVQVPDAAAETVTVGDAVVRLGGTVPEGPWGELAELLRGLAGELARPSAAVAAIELEVTPDGRAASLLHAGPEQLGVDLSQLQTTAVLFDADGSELGRWDAPRPASPAGLVDAGPGWKQPLAFDHHLELRPGRTLQVSAAFALDDGAVLAAATVRG